MGLRKGPDSVSALTNQEHPDYSTESKVFETIVTVPKLPASYSEALPERKGTWPGASALIQGPVKHVSIRIYPFHLAARQP